MAAVLVLVFAKPAGEKRAAAEKAPFVEEHEESPAGSRFRTKLDRFAFRARGSPARAQGGASAGRSRTYQLSARETDVAEQLVIDRGYARIQQGLCIAEGTVNYHTRNIYAKTDVHTREGLIDLFDAFEQVGQ